jgi:hypothetical protein
MVSGDQTNTSKTGWRRKTPSEQAIGVVFGASLAVLPSTGAQRPFEALAIPLIQIYFHEATAFQKSVASSR